MPSYFVQQFWVRSRFVIFHSWLHFQTCPYPNFRSELLQDPARQHFPGILGPDSAEGVQCDGVLKKVWGAEERELFSVSLRRDPGSMLLGEPGGSQINYTDVPRGLQAE